TSEVYGDPLEHPQKESYYGNVNSYGPRSLYDESKRLGETLCYEYQRKFNVEVRIVRIFNCYGPRMDPEDGRVVTNFILQRMNKQPYTIYGDGQQTRSMCYIEDMLDGLTALMASDYKSPMNLGTEQEVTIMQLAEIVDIAFDKSKTSNKIWLSLPKDDPKQRRPDLTIAKKVINWNPKVS